MVKKLIIIEGTDNSGKDTLIKNLVERYKNELIDIRHFDRPKSTTNKEAAAEQDDLFMSFVKSLTEVDDDRIVICNRAWYGEFIYGTMYRGRTQDEVIDMIYNVEQFLIDNKIDSTYIQLYADPSFLSTHDDGQSLSEGKMETIKQEAELFDLIYHLSKLPKKEMIETSVCGTFVGQDLICDKAVEAIERSVVTMNVNI